MNRKLNLQHIKDNPRVSVLIIGAGINGIGTFRDLSLQGVDCIIVERADFCSGTSATSSHMIHGGIRYLENGGFRLVREAVRERNALLRNAPHLITQLPTIIPIYKMFSGLMNAPIKFLRLAKKSSERGLAVIKIGMSLYDSFTQQQGGVPNHEFISRKKALEQFPKLNPAILAAARYYDAAITAPERLCLELLADGERASS
ncbi:MAG: FAD-dependent oxidoreductase, partial [Chloroflexota bacterium]